MQNSILQEKDDLLQNQLEWLAEKEQIRKMNHLEKDVLKINAGGTIILTSIQVLTSVPLSKLDKVFSGKLTELKRIDDAIFLDRNGKIFEAMIDYLRDERVKMPRFSELNDQIRFTNELKFWGMAPYFT